MKRMRTEAKNKDKIDELYDQPGIVSTPKWRSLKRMQQKGPVDE